MTETLSAQRYPHLDFLRAVAIIAMIIFHIAYDLKMFRMNELNFHEGFWFALPRAIAFTFLFCVGMSLHFSHVENFRKKEFFKRNLKLLVSALAISVVTYVSYPDNWVYFGTLHCIFLGSVLGVWFVWHRKAALGLMLMIIFLQYFAGYDIKWMSTVVNKPAMDFIPIYPWFWAILLGILVAPWSTKISILVNVRCPVFFRFLSRHSLKIYLIHQPVIIGALYLLNDK